MSSSMLAVLPTPNIVGQLFPYTFNSSLGGTICTIKLTGEGYRLVIAAARGYHTDGANTHRLSWGWTEYSPSYLAVPLETSLTDLAANEETVLYDHVPCPRPLWCTYQSYLNLTSADAVGAAARIYVKLWAYKVRGMEAWSNR